MHASNKTKGQVVRRQMHAPTVITPTTKARLGRIRSRLLSWYHDNYRPLAWRNPDPRTARPNPYHVLVSEIMLQQTQVATVKDYFKRFLKRFPNVNALANADEQQVLTVWQGLGYYRRARYLHGAAQQIRDRFHGRVPSTTQDLITLPGVGRSTAGAIASIAHGQTAPILDGNVKRVLARLENVDGSIDEPRIQEHLWTLSSAIVRGDDPGNLNQALMELGAVLCLPANPKCTRCPVRRSCLAARHGTTDTIPRRSPRRKPKPVYHHVIAIQRSGNYLLQRRPESGLWSSMWQLPTIEGLTTPNIDTELIDWTKDQLGLSIGSTKMIDRFEHVTTHRRISFTLWSTGTCRGRLRRGAGIWRKLARTDDLPLPNPQRRVIDLISKSDG